MTIPDLSTPLGPFFAPSRRSVFALTITFSGLLDSEFMEKVCGTDNDVADHEAYTEVAVSATCARARRVKDRHGEPDGVVAGAFLSFTLSHAGCGEDIVETRLGEGLLECWCPRCNESRTFGVAGEELPAPGREGAGKAREREERQVRETERETLEKGKNIARAVPGEESAKTEDISIPDYVMLDFDTSEEAASGPGYVEAREAARILGISQRAVRNLIGRKTLESKRDGEGAAARVVVSLASVERLRSERLREHQTFERSDGHERREE